MLCRLNSRGIVAMSNDEKKQAVTRGGSEIVQHEFVDTAYAELPGPIIKRISDHIEEHVGPISLVQHENVSRAVHIDIHWVSPSDKRPFHTLVTTGLSAKSMASAPGASDIAFAELMICLAPDWPINRVDLKKWENAWPTYLLRRLAALPHETGGCFKVGDTIPNGSDAKPYADDTEYCCFLIRRPTLFGNMFPTLDFGRGRKIHFFALVPIFFEEMDFILEYGANALEEKFEEINLTEIIKRKRSNVCKS